MIWRGENFSSLKRKCCTRKSVEILQIICMCVNATCNVQTIYSRMFITYPNAYRFLDFCTFIEYHFWSSIVNTYIHFDLHVICCICGYLNYGAAYNMHCLRIQSFVNMCRVKRVNVWTKNEIISTIHSICTFLPSSYILYLPQYMRLQ